MQPLPAPFSALDALRRTTDTRSSDIAADLQESTQQGIAHESASGQSRSSNMTADSHDEKEWQRMQDLGMKRNPELNAASDAGAAFHYQKQWQKMQVLRDRRNTDSIRPTVIPNPQAQSQLAALAGGDQKDFSTGKSSKEFLDASNVSDTLLVSHFAERASTEEAQGCNTEVSPDFNRPCEDAAVQLSLHRDAFARMDSEENQTALEGADRHIFKEEVSRPASSKSSDMEVSRNDHAKPIAAPESLSEADARRERQWKHMQNLRSKPVEDQETERKEERKDHRDLTGTDRASPCVNIQATKIVSAEHAFFLAGPCSHHDDADAQAVCNGSRSGMHHEAPKSVDEPHDRNSAHVLASSHGQVGDDQNQEDAGKHLHKPQLLKSSSGVPSSSKDDILVSPPGSWALAAQEYWPRDAPSQEEEEENKQLMKTQTIAQDAPIGMGAMSVSCNENTLVNHIGLQEWSSEVLCPPYDPAHPTEKQACDQGHAHQDQKEVEDQVAFFEYPFLAEENDGWSASGSLTKCVGVRLVLDLNFDIVTAEEEKFKELLRRDVCESISAKITRVQISGGLPWISSCCFARRIST